MYEKKTVVPFLFSREWEDCFQRTYFSAQTKFFVQVFSGRPRNSYRYRKRFFSSVKTVFELVEKVKDSFGRWNYPTDTRMQKRSDVTCLIMVFLRIRTFSLIVKYLVTRKTVALLVELHLTIGHIWNITIFSILKNFYTNKFQFLNLQLKKHWLLITFLKFLQSLFFKKIFSNDKV